MHALHYTSVKTPADGNKVFGLQVAILDLVRAWFRHGKADKFNVLVGDAAAQKEIEEAARLAGLDHSRLAILDQRYPRENLAQFDVVFRADPDSQRLFWQRRLLENNGFAFCGLSHAMSGLEGGEVLQQYCLAPSSGADAIICPSNALASAIRAFFDNYAEYLRVRFGAIYRCPVQLPVIPLGIDVDKFAAKVTPDKRAAQRSQLGLGEKDVMLLWVGRLSYAIKAHPIAMFQAAERAAELTGAPIHLVMQGYFMPAEAEAQFTQLAKDVCKKSRVHFIKPDDPRFPDGLWAAGDIFLSLIDNMQESFGLTPVEAMAARMPRVISDWDGYRDCIANGVDGFLVRTLTPPPGNGAALSELLLGGREMYGGFLGKTALSTIVDTDMAAQAIQTLIENKPKRDAIVEKAFARVTSSYDWSRLIPAYENLWNELATRRRADAQKLAWPLVPDPFTMYAAYPTAALAKSNRLAVSASPETIRQLLSQYINAFGLDVMVPGDVLMELITRIAKQDGITIEALFLVFPNHDRAQMWRTIAWLIKLGILRLQP